MDWIVADEHTQRKCSHRNITAYFRISEYFNPLHRVIVTTICTLALL